MSRGSGNAAIDALQKAWKASLYEPGSLPAWTKGDPGITRPLVLPESESNKLGLERPCPCLICDKVEVSFQVPSQQNELLQHLLHKHKVVIADVHLVSDLPAYIKYWRQKMKNGVPLTEFASTMSASVTTGKGAKAKVEEEEDFYLLSDALQEDRELRIQLQRQRLEDVLAFQDKERRQTDFVRECLFCRAEIVGRPGDLLDHMAKEHNFSVGLPNNLVFICELLDVLEKKLEEMKCIFCEKVFKTREVMKEHMRKKGHKKINPKNESYDKFYLVNYLEFGKNWEAIISENDIEDDLPTGFDSDSSDVADSDWSDWTDPPQSGIVCLFCPANYPQVDDLLQHMNSIHEFDFQQVRHSLRLNFYQQVKLVNYIRRQVHLLKCMYCLESFASMGALGEHMLAEGHAKVPDDIKEWDQPEYFFPTYENDNLLNNLDDESYEADSSVPEINSEDLPESLANSVLKDVNVRSGICPSKHKKGN